MLKKALQELAQYNIWANTKYITWAETLSEDQWKMPILSSFNSIEKTCLHTLCAEKIWFERLSHHEQPEWIMDSYTGSKTELLNLWMSYSEKLLSLIENQSEAQLNEFFSFTNLAGAYSSMEVYKAFMHVFNHSTYHRGQLTTMYRQAGFTDISTSDLINYHRGV